MHSAPLVTPLISSVTHTCHNSGAAEAELSMGSIDPWIGLTHGFGWVEIFQFLVGLAGFNAFKARFDKIWLHQAVKFDFMADLTGTGN